MHAYRIMAVEKNSPSKCHTSLKIDDSSSGEFVSLVFHRCYLCDALN